MEDILKSTILEKVNAHDAEMEALKEKVAGLLDYKQVLETQNTRMGELQTALNNIKFPVKTMQDLSVNLKDSIQAWKEPSRTVHHHHFPKIAFATAGLFLLLALAGVGWYMTRQELDRYKASDIKYRYLKLTKSPSLQALLYETDSIYQKDGEAVTESVIEQEAERQWRRELLEQAAKKELDAKLLREKANNRNDEYK